MLQVSSSSVEGKEGVLAKQLVKFIAVAMGFLTKAKNIFHY